MKNKVWSVLLLSLILSSVSAETRTTEYDWLTLGKKSGELKVSYHTDGKQTTTFKFNDRGRGPNISEEIHLDASGQLLSFKAIGKSYMGVQVNESFTLSEQKAKWHSTNEQGETIVNTPVAYVNVEGSPESLAVLLRAVLNQADQTMALLPSGTASVQELLSTTVKNNEQEKKVKLMALSGLSLTPNYVWLDEHNQLFAVTYGWMGMTPVGWNIVLEDLQKLQDEADKSFHLKQAKSLTESLADTVLIKNVNVLDVKQGKLLSDQAVLIEAGVIKAVGLNTSDLKATQIIDGHGKTLMPGLWDMHTHIRLSNGLLQIAAGVTSARDLGNNHDDLVQTIKAFDNGEVIGPHVYKAGFIDQKSPFASPTGKLAETLEQALEYVDWYAERGYPQIKIYSSITPDWVKSIAERTHQHGMKLSGHIPSFMTTEQAVKDGYDEIQHINMLFLNFLAGKDDDTRTPVRFTLVGEKAGSLDLNSKKVKDFIELLKDQEIVVDPTVTIFHSMFMNKPGEIDPNFAMIADHLPTNIRRSFLGSTLEISEQQIPNYRRSAQALLKMVKMLHDAGIQLVAGTDAISGFTLHRELELYVEAGLSNADVLRIATIEAAKVAGQADQTGSVEVGKKADLVLVDGNPLENISAVRKAVWTIKGEKKYSSAKLYRSIGIKPFTDIE